MRRRLTALLLPFLLLLGLLPACESSASSSAPAGYALYFLSQADSGPSLEAEYWVPEEETEVGPEELLDALLAGPTREDLSSPFPRGTSVLQCTPDPDNEGNLLVRLSEQYGGLTDISLTLADYSITLTLGQLEGVTSVQISAAGLSSSSRSHPILLPEEADLEEILP